MSRQHLKSCKQVHTIAADDPDQLTMAGIARVSLVERLTWQAQQPMQAKRQQRPLDIGFWNPMRNQLEML